MSSKEEHAKFLESHGLSVAAAQKAKAQHNDGTEETHATADGEVWWRDEEGVWRDENGLAVLPDELAAEGVR